MNYLEHTFPLFVSLRSRQFLIKNKTPRICEALCLNLSRVAVLPGYGNTYRIANYAYLFIAHHIAQFKLIHFANPGSRGVRV